MTKEAALYNFWSSFALPAYEENSVFGLETPPDYPYITYEICTDSFDNTVSLTGSLWYRSTSWNAANAKKREISEFIGMGGLTAPIDGGQIWIRRGSPFAQNMGDDTDDMIKRVLLNIQVEFFTEN